MTEPDLTALAAEAYVYGFPLVFDLDQVRRFTGSGMGTLPAAPFNAFSHAGLLAGPQDTFVSVNNDTVYSIAQLDLSRRAAACCDVPDTGGRYYVLQFVDAWTNNFAYVGRRATGTGGGRLPAGAAGLGGRGARRRDGHPAAHEGGHRSSAAWPATAPDDLPAVARAAGRASPDAARSDAAPRACPTPTDGVPERPALLRAAAPLDGRPSRPLPPAGGLQERFAPLGLTGTAPPLRGPAARARRALTEGSPAGRERVEAAVHGGRRPSGNGWISSVHVFDYNLDFLEIGTIDAPEWKISDRPPRT